MTMAQPNEAAHNSEYETLRAELLSLKDLAFNAWRWGLLELATLTGIVVAQVLTNNFGFAGIHFGIRFEEDTGG